TQGPPGGVGVLRLQRQHVPGGGYGGFRGRGGGEKLGPAAQRTGGGRGEADLRGRHGRECSTGPGLGSAGATVVAAPPTGHPGHGRDVTRATRRARSHARAHGKPRNTTLTRQGTMTDPTNPGSPTGAPAPGPGGRTPPATR